MRPLLVSSRSVLYPLAIEAAITLLVIFLLGKLTLAIAPAIAGSLGPVEITGVAVPLAASVSLARHTRRRFRGSLVQEAALVAVLALALGAAASVAYSLFSDQRSTGFVVTLMSESAFVVPAAAYAWRWLAGRLRVPGFTTERIVVVGSGQLALHVCDYVEEQHPEEFRIVGIVPAEPERTTAPPALAPPIDVASLTKLSNREIDRVVVALEEKRGRLPVRELIDLRLRGITIEQATSFIERTSGKIHIPALLPSWLIFSEGFRISPLRALMKRSGDLVLSTLLLIVSSPLFVLTAVAIRLEGRGPIFYRQERVGFEERKFRIVKFRSMRPDAEALSGPTWAEEHDPRITRVGRVIRRLRIDELPQIWNVFKGDMSFVGPRPERPHFVEQLATRIPFYALRHSTRPGITGWAQVRYRYGASEEDSLEKLKYDLFYIKNASMLLDVWIVLNTIRVVLGASGSR